MRFISNLASVIAILGLVAIITGLFNRLPSVLKWIDNWGATISWIIKISLVTGGGLLWFIVRPKSSNEVDEK